ncbi:hypothetical protein D3C72_1142690 [compost metagenome]
MENGLDLSNVKVGSVIKYIGDSIAYGGSYTVYAAESTYINQSDCPEDDRGKLMIIEFMNDDTPMFFRVDRLQLKEWKLL